MRMKTIEITLPEYTYKRLEELAARMGLEASEAAGEIISERVRHGQLQGLFEASLPVMEARAFSLCVEAMSPLTDPDSANRVFKYLMESCVAQMRQQKRAIEIEEKALIESRIQHWREKIAAGEMIVPPPTPDELTN